MSPFLCVLSLTLCALSSTGCVAELAVEAAKYYSSPKQPTYRGTPVQIEALPPGARIQGVGYSVVAPAGPHWVLVEGHVGPAPAGKLVFVRDPAVSRAYSPVDLDRKGVTAEGLRHEAGDSTPLDEAARLLAGCVGPTCQFAQREIVDEPGRGCARYLVVMLARRGSGWPPVLVQATVAGRVCQLPSAPGVFVHLAFRELQPPGSKSQYLPEARVFLDSIEFDRR